MLIKVKLFDAVVVEHYVNKQKDKKSLVFQQNVST